ncbi:MAG: DNA primase [Cyanobacteria bacterium J06621_12]
MKVPRLHPDTIEEVQQRADIVDVISEHIVLKKRGKDFLGLCPFHNEKTPSFSVSQDKQVYYCFGCSEGGNTYKFLMEIGKQSFAEVVLDLARRYQVEIKTVEPEQRQEIQRQLTLKEQLYEILAISSSFFQHALQSSQGEVALNYLRSLRHVEENTISRFELGYAPMGWETLYRYLVEQKRYPVNLVEQAGLIKPRKSGSGYYDVFRDRLMIPITDLQGRIIAFGSRSLKDEDQPKYLNSPETPLFNKSKTLFALDKARSAIGKADCAVVVEGYFDAIALHEAGIDHVVASLGTAFTQDQLKQLLRFTPSKQVILNFDADNAGKKATERAIGEVEDLVYGGVVQLRILNLPNGKDADEFIRGRALRSPQSPVNPVKSSPEGVVLYHQALETAPLWLDWLIERLLAGKDLKAADEFQLCAVGIVKLLNKLQDANQRNHYLTHCAELLSQGDSRLVLQNLAALKSQIKSPRSQYRNSNTQQKQTKSTTAKFAIAKDPESELLEQAEALLLRIYIHYPRYRDRIIDELETKDLLFNLASHRFLWQQIITAEEAIPSSSLSNVNPLLSELHNLSPRFPQNMMAITKLFHLDEKTQEDVFRAEVRIAEAIASLEQVNYQKRQIYCSQQLQNLDPATDIKLMEYYCQEIQTAIEKIRQLEQIRLNYAQDPVI